MYFNLSTHILFAMIFLALGFFNLFKINSKSKKYIIYGLISIVIGIIFIILHFNM